jgi:hypothetical protein
VTKLPSATKRSTGKRKPVRVLIDYSQMEHPQESGDPGLCPELPLPPWHAGNQRDRRWMIDWTIGRWSMLPDPSQPAVSSDVDSKKFRAWWYNGGREIEEAEHGDIEPLREKFPHLARFLHLPVRPDKKNWPMQNEARSARDKSAEMIMREIKAIWKDKKYYGRVHRPRGDVTAAEIAAEILNTKANLILKRQKLLGQERRRKKAAAAGMR